MPDLDSEVTLTGLAWGTCAFRKRSLWPVLLGQVSMHTAEAEKGGRPCYQPRGPKGGEGGSPWESEILPNSYIAGGNWWKMVKPFWKTV